MPRDQVFFHGDYLYVLGDVVGKRSQKDALRLYEAYIPIFTAEEVDKSPVVKLCKCADFYESRRHVVTIFPIAPYCSSSTEPSIVARASRRNPRSPFGSEDGIIQEILVGLSLTMVPSQSVTCVPWCGHE